MQTLNLSMIVAARRRDGAAGGTADAGGRPGPCRRSKIAPPACTRSTATSRCTGTSAPARCSSRSRGFDTDFLFTTGLSAGLGSNDIGLDRGQGGAGPHRHVPARRAARDAGAGATSRSARAASNPLERKSVEDSFAKSMLWGFTVAAESSGRVLVDATDFFLRDVHGAGGALRPGNYRVDRTRSAFYLPNTKGFPKNTEIDVTLTFVERAPAAGAAAAAARRRARRRSAPAAAAAAAVAAAASSPARVGSVTPTADAVTLREHVSFVELPDGNYKPRVDDPRAGYGGLQLRRLQHADRRADRACATSAATGSRRRTRPRRSASR